MGQKVLLMTDRQMDGQTNRLTNKGKKVYLLLLQSEDIHVIILLPIERKLHKTPAALSVTRVLLPIQESHTCIDHPYRHRLTNGKTLIRNTFTIFLNF